MFDMTSSGPQLVAIGRVAASCCHRKKRSWVGTDWAHVQRTTEEENGRAAKARAGVRLARAKAVRWRNIVQVVDVMTTVERGDEDLEREFGVEVSLKPLRPVVGRIVSTAG